MMMTIRFAGHKYSKEVPNLFARLSSRLATLTRIDAHALALAVFALLFGENGFPADTANYDELFAYVASVDYELAYNSNEAPKGFCEDLLKAFQSADGSVEIVPPTRRFGSIEELPKELEIYEDSFSAWHWKYGYEYIATRNLRYYKVDLDQDGSQERVFFGENLYTDASLSWPWRPAFVSAYRSGEEKAYKRWSLDGSRFNNYLDRDTRNWNGILRFRGEYHIFDVTEYFQSTKYEAIRLYHTTKYAPKQTCLFVDLNGGE